MQHKKEIEPGAQRRPTDNGEDRSKATLRAGAGACLVVNELWALRIAIKTTYTLSPAFFRPPLCRLRSGAPGSNIEGGRLPVVSSLRDSTTGYCLSPLSGLKIPLASLANTPSTSDLSRKEQVFTKLALSCGAELFVAPMEQDAQREACGVDEHGCRDSRNGDDFTISAFGTG